MKKSLFLTALCLLFSWVISTGSFAAVIQQPHKPVKVKPKPRRHTPVNTQRMQKQAEQAERHEVRDARAEEAQKKAEKAHQDNHVH